MENITKEAFEYALKHELLRDGELDKTYVRQKAINLHLPKWFRDLISEDGKCFASLSQFPTGVVMRVCRDGEDQTLQVGQLVYRGTNADEREVLNCISRYGGWLEEDVADIALKGAEFEQTEMKVK